MNSHLRYTIIVFLLSTLLPLYAQESTERENLVYLLNADELRYNEYLTADAQLLVGNVVFRHDSMYMYCDSALFFQAANTFNAYHNVRVEQGDTLFLYGDSLYYDGNTRIARVRNNVRVENTTMVLLTDSLNYERDIDLGYFFGGGTLIDATTTLTSGYGEFQTETKQAKFINDVYLENEEYTIFTDTLFYNTEAHLASFVSPTKIVTGNTTILTSRGWFSTETNDATLLQRSTIELDGGEKSIVGDSIIFNDKEGNAEAFGGVEIRNYLDKVDVESEYAYFNNETDSAVITGRAMIIEYSSGDSLYLHADTFRIVSFYNVTGDTLLYREMRGFNRVKGYRRDMQMVADSMVFSSVDSCLTLYKDPIIWSENQQVLGEKICIYMNDSTIDWAHVIGQALFVQRIDSVCYNQIAGREMKAFFLDGAMEHTDVNGNVMVIYYPEDEYGDLMGMNTTEASHLTAFFTEQMVSKIVIYEKSSGVMYPMQQIKEKDMYLSNFVWFSHLRPFSKNDIFSWRAKQEKERLKASPSIDIPLPTLKSKR